MLTAEQFKRAKCLNRLYARTVNLLSRPAERRGWIDRFRQIIVVLEHTETSSPSENEFAELVAAWQAANGLRPVDGVLGERTWSRIEPHTRFSLVKNAPLPQWLTLPFDRARCDVTSTPATARSPMTIPGRGWMFVVVDQLPEVGVRNVIRKVAVIPRDFSLSPPNPAGKLRPAIHALGDHAKGNLIEASQFLSASDRPYGAATMRGHPLLIDTQKVRQAGGRLISSADVVADLQAFAAENPNTRVRVERLVAAIRDFEGESLIEGGAPPRSVTPLRRTHKPYVRRGEEIYDAIVGERMVRQEGASQLRSLDNAYRSARNLGRAGRVVGIAGLVLSAVEVVSAANESVERKSFRPITAESVRQLGGWGSAFAGAKVGFVAGAVMGIETGPGAIVTGAIGAIFLGFAGYIGADWIADLIHTN